MNKDLLEEVFGKKLNAKNGETLDDARLSHLENMSLYDIALTCDSSRELFVLESDD